MAAVGEDRDSLWVDGRFTVRVRGPEPGRVIRLRRPFALIGRLPGADIRIDDPAVEDRHVFLMLDSRGIFGVDLRTRAGTRFAGADAASARLGAGDILEVAGRRVELLQLRVDGAVIDPPIGDDDPLAEADPSALVALTLEPVGSPGLPWMLGSALAFAGRGEACAIRVEGASETHCALLRCPSTAYVIDLLGQSTRLNDRPVAGASALLDGNVLSVGPARFAVRLDPPRGRPEGEGEPRVLARLADTDPGAPGLPGELASGPRAAMLALLLSEAARHQETPPGEVLEVLRSFQADAASLFEVQIDRIEALGREIAILREELQARRGPPLETPEPLRLDLSSLAPTDSVESAAWLLDRINGLETETRSTWRDLLARITSTARPRTHSGPLS